MHEPRAILIDIAPPTLTKPELERRLLELRSLTETFGGIVIVELIQKRSVPDYRTYIGAGKVDELIELAKTKRADIVIVNNVLKPKQTFELEERFRKAKTPLKVWDRVDLILKIFDKHARTSEAKLQIKLAAIDHMGPRIFGMGMEMMQQVGGIGARGGQGETNTELMKRHLRTQREHTVAELERVAASRELHRKQRDRQQLKTVSVVGYTNAGKSTLVNALTKKGAYAADALFATLDTHVGRLWLADEQAPHGGRELLISDTIGFIQDLPPSLIQAFKSTLDETVHAELLLHVIDASDPYRDQKIAEVEEILSQIGVTDTPKLYVFNKIDQLKRVPRKTLEKRYVAFSPCFVSAKTGEGIDQLKELLKKSLF